MPVVAVVCLVLLALLTVVQVAHMHAVDRDAGQCQLCVAMHTAAPVAVFAALVLLVRMRAAAPILAVSAVARHRHPKLFTRPPPSLG